MNHFCRKCITLTVVALLGLSALVGCQTPRGGGLLLPGESQTANSVASSSQVALAQAEELAAPSEELDEPEPSPIVAETLPQVPRMPVEMEAPGCYHGAPTTPLPRMLVTPWKPPGIACPWPEDEWIHDGGDRNVHVNITTEPEIRALDLEDTVVHADTINGCKIIEPSNRVHLYAPRFMAVRQVANLAVNQQQEKAGGTDQPVGLIARTDLQMLDTAIKPVAPVADTGIKQLSLARLDQPAGRVIERLMVADMHSRVMPYEDLQIIKMGVFEMEEKAVLEQRQLAAITWSHDKAVQVVLDGRMAGEVTGDQRVQATFRIDEPCNPRLRVVKVASTQAARQGDIVDFTIRFDNVGDQELANVELLDNLTTRLEYVEGSAQASLDSEFYSERNEGDSLLLRWQFKEPIKPGDGGLVRFKCRVR
jgi:uncharacterized repeat protein (TIGR01451 family)